MRRRDVLRTGAVAIVFGACLAAMSGGSAVAADKVILKASDVHPLGYPTVEAVVRMGKKLSDATKGKYELQMFPAMQLGGEKEALEQVQIGALAMTRVSVGVVGPIVDDVNVFNMPFLFKSQDQERKVLDGEIGAELLKAITDNAKAGMIGLAWMDSGSRSVFNSKRAIRVPADLKGLKIRMMGNPLYVDTMNAMGGSGIAMGMDEVYNGIATGVVDGAENNPPSYVSFNLINVAKFYSITEHLMIPEILVFSKKVFNSLPAEDQKLVLKFGRESQAEERELWDKKVIEALDTIKKTPGVTMNTDVDKAAFQAAVKPVWDKYGAKYAKMIERIQAVK